MGLPRIIDVPLDGACWVSVDVTWQIRFRTSLKVKMTLTKIVLAGCATAPAYRPVVDTKGVDLLQYEIDLDDCKHYAEQVDPVRNAVAGAIAVGIFGAVLGAATGDRQLMQYGLRTGAIDGAAAGTVAGIAAKHHILVRCLSGRGYNVLAG
jgi:hypothetical protein